jgi:hypothetical protein
MGETLMFCGLQFTRIGGDPYREKSEARIIRFLRAEYRGDLMHGLCCGK